MPRLLRGLLLLCFILASIAYDPPLAQEPESADFLRIPNLSGLRGGNIVLAVSADPTSFNRMMAAGLPGATITDRLSAGLVHINRSSLQVEPALAARWESDQSGRIFTLHLRRGVRFSDGSPFTADDVVFSFQALTDPKIQCPLAGQIEVDGAFPSVKKLDEFTIQLAFKNPVGMGLRMLDSVPILPKSRLLKAYQQGRFDSAWGPTVNPAEVVGLGPYRLKEYQRNVKVVLERNSYYWKKDRSGQTLPYLDTITLLIIPDLNSEALRFRQGELDMMCSPSLNPEHYASLRRSLKNYTLRDLGPGITMDYVWFNLNRGSNRAGKPFVDPEKLALFEKPEFRLAVSHALDRDGMVRSTLLGLGVPQYGPVSTGNRQWHYGGTPKTGYSPARARELLAKIGLRDSDRDGILEYGAMRRPLEISLFTSRGNNVREKAAQIIQDNLAKIGIRIAIQNLLPNEIASRFLDSFDYEAILFGFTGTDIAPDLQTNLWYSSGNIHFWQPNQTKPEREWEAAIDALITKLIRSTDSAERKAAFNRAQDIWAKNMPAIPTIAPNILAGWSNRLGNIRPSILPPHLIWNAEEITKLRR
ncbi:MAG: ABC transporter substrate-binding protein [Acidobacteria bacterium]|nr:ABC transporter substrate-binding protein [Acidobacteriota bacterium]